MTPTQAERAARRARKFAKRETALAAFGAAREAYHRGTGHGKLTAARYLKANPHRREEVESPLSSDQKRAAIAALRNLIDVWPANGRSTTGRLGELRVVGVS